jgi:hypothetical protein
MLRRAALVLIVGSSLCGCAGFAQDDFAFDASPTPAAEAPTSAQDLAAGQAAHARGDDADARRLWTRCVEESAASAPEHLDCLVSIERLAPPPGSN